MALPKAAASPIRSIKPDTQNKKTEATAKRVVDSATLRRDASLGATHSTPLPQVPRTNQRASTPDTVDEFPEAVQRGSPLKTLNHNPSPVSPYSPSVNSSVNRSVAQPTSPNRSTANVNSQTEASSSAPSEDGPSPTAKTSVSPPQDGVEANKKKRKAEDPANGSGLCPGVLSSGENRGKICGKKLFGSYGYCRSHIPSKEKNALKEASRAKKLACGMRVLDYNFNEIGASTSKQVVAAPIASTSKDAAKTEVYSKAPLQWQTVPLVHPPAIQSLLSTSSQDSVLSSPFTFQVTPPSLNRDPLPPPAQNNLRDNTLDQAAEGSMTPFPTAPTALQISDAALLSILPTPPETIQFEDAELGLGPAFLPDTSSLPLPGLLTEFPMFYPPVQGWPAAQVHSQFSEEDYNLFGSQDFGYGDGQQDLYAPVAAGTETEQPRPDETVNLSEWVNDDLFEVDNTPVISNEATGHSDLLGFEVQGETLGMNKRTRYI